MTTEIDFYRNVTGEEGDVVKIGLKRSGDLSVPTLVTFGIDWSRSSANASDVSYIGASGDGNAVFSLSSGQGIAAFEPGEDTVWLHFRLTDDSRTESDERLYLEIISALGAEIGDESDYIKIEDNDEVDPVELDLDNVDVVEGQIASMPIQLHGGETQELIFIRYTVISGHEHVKSNFHSGTWAIPAGSKDYAYLPIPTVSDGDRMDESVRVQIELIGSYDGVSVRDDDARIDITDTTPRPDPVLSLHDGGFVDEGNFVGAFAKLSSPLDYDFSFVVDTYRGTANNGHDNDYTGRTDLVVTIRAGQTQSEPIPIFVNPDTVANEGLETFRIVVQPNSFMGATLGDGAIVESGV